MLHNDRMCLSKKVYWTETEARTKADRCEAKRGVKLRVYHCPVCNQYHLTKQCP